MGGRLSHNVRVGTHVLLRTIVRRPEMQPGAEWKKRFAPNGADRFERYAREFVEMRKRKTHGVDGASTSGRCNARA